jgi:HlyD family secretion protein
MPAMRGVLPFVFLLAACTGENDGRLYGYVEGDVLNLAAEEGGVLVDLLVEEGERVEAGALLFRLDDKEAKLRVDRAQAEVAAVTARAAEEGAWQQLVQEAEAAFNLARENFQRTEKLYRQKIVERARLDADRSARDSARANLERARSERAAAIREGAAAEAELALAEERLADLEVRAPKAGSVERIYRRPGEVIAAAEPILALLPPESVKLRFYLPETRLAALSLGAEVAFSCDGCASGRTAKVSFIATEPQFTPPVIYSLEERAKLVYLVEARPASAEGLRPGLPVEVTAP